MESTRSHKAEALLVAALTALVAAALIAVDMAQHAFDSFVWLGGAPLAATLVAL